MHATRALVLTSSLLLFAGCAATAHERQVRDLRATVEGLQGDVRRLDRQLTDLSNQLLVFSDQLTQARGRQRPQPAEASASPATELPALAVVRLAPTTPALRPPPRAASAPEPAVDIVLEGSPDDDTLEVAAVPPPPRDTRGDVAAADAAMRDALAAYRDGKFADAAKLLTGVLTRFPAYAQADKALYWLAESHVELGQPARAEQELSTLLSRYPRSDKAAEAMLKLALAYERQGKAGEAKQTLGELARRYPNTASGDLARARLIADASGVER